MKTFGLLLGVLMIIQVQAQRSDFDAIDFKKADSIALTHKNAGLKNLPELAHHLTSDLDTEVEKFRAIYMWVCTNVANDYRLYLKNKKKEKSLKMTV